MQKAALDCLKEIENVTNGTGRHIAEVLMLMAGAADAGCKNKMRFEKSFLAELKDRLARCLWLLPRESEVRKIILKNAGKLFAALGENTDLAVNHKAREEDRLNGDEVKIIIPDKGTGSAEADSSEQQNGPVLIHRSRKMAEVLRRAEAVAPRDLAVLVCGATGTGKELIARFIHHKSTRAQKCLCACNIAAKPQGLIDSELFGHEQGAFTNARKGKKGLFEIADGGTLFLDEIGDMPLEVQAKLLRVLQNGVITRVGSNEEFKTNVRVISATNKDLERLCREGLFRTDLYHRLNGFKITLPPLAQRGDVEELVNYYLDHYLQMHGKNNELSDEARQFLLNYPFPGNVRELMNMLNAAVIICPEGEKIKAEDLVG